MLVVVPVVGFAGQSVGVVERTIALLVEEAADDIHRGRRCIVVVVNRPSRCSPDDTLLRVRRLFRGLAPLASDRVQLAVCDLALLRRPRMGELRQLGLDAVEQALGKLSPDAAVAVTDDDLVSIPSGALAELERITSDGAALAVGPVLFDDPKMPLWRIPALLVAEAVRAILVERLLGALEVPGNGSDRPDDSVYESLVLSGNLAVRRDALDAIRGFCDLNEITRLMRDVLGAGGRLAQPAVRAPARPVRIGGPLESLRRRAVRVSSRRALLAWRTGGHPTVAQWRGCRFRASEADEARMRQVTFDDLVAPDPLGPKSRTAFVASVEQAIATTLGYLQPDVGLAAWALRQIGIDEADASLRLTADRSRWLLRLRRPDGLIERVAAMRDAEREYLTEQRKPRAAPRSGPALRELTHR